MILMFAFVIPVILGMAVTGILGEKYENSVVAALIAGTMLLFAMFELIAVPVIITERKFQYVFVIWVAVVLISSVIVLIKNRKRIRPMIAYTRKKIFSSGAVGIAAAAIVLFQACFLAWNLHYDDDDARYIPSIVSALEKGTLFVDNPVTGETMYWDISETAKDMISPWVIFWAVLCRLCMIHPAIVCHTVVPMLYIPIAYLVYVLMGKELFEDDMKKTSIFVILVSLLNIFSGYSVYNSGSFLLLRIWQGKALFAGMVLPFLFWIAIKFLKNDFSRKECVLALIGCMAASMTTGFGIFLAPCFLFICMVIHGFLYDRWDLYVRITAAMLPNIIYAVLYVFGQKLFMS